MIKKEETARLYRLAEVHKKESPLRPVLSIPGSCYHKLSKFLNPFFQKIERANIETSINDAHKTLEQKLLEKDEQILPFFAKICFRKHKNAVTASILFTRKKMLPLSKNKLTAKKIEILRKIKNPLFKVLFI